MDSATAIMDPSVTRMLVSSQEPYVSVYIGLQAAEFSSNTSEDRALRWRALAERLRAQRADEASIDAVARHLEEQPVYPSEYAIFAAAGVVRFAQRIPGAMIGLASPGDQARFGQPAYLVPLLNWQQRHPGYVVVLADRTGADLVSVPRGTVDGFRSVVHGPDDVIESNAPGGWSQASYQRRAQDSWHHNAAAVAEAAAHALHRINARLLLVTGDVRAVQLLEEQLPAAVRRGVVLRHLSGGRGPDREAPLHQEAIDEAVADFAEQTSSQLLAQLADERRPGGTGVEGVSATLDALARGQVATLFVADDPNDERLGWFGPGSPDEAIRTLCAEVAEDRPAQVGGWLVAGRLVDVAVRAALLTGAEVRVLPLAQADAMDGRIGALCRFAPAPASADGGYPAGGGPR